MYCLKKEPAAVTESAPAPEEPVASEEPAAEPAAVEQEAAQPEAEPVQVFRDLFLFYDYAVIFDVI